MDSDGRGGVAPHATWRLKDGALSTDGMVATLYRKGGLPVHGCLPRNIGIAPEPLVALMEEWRKRHATAIDTNERV